MKERPILFSAPMVRSILSGAKTQTRRVFKLPRGCSWFAAHGGESAGMVQDDDGPAWWHVDEQRCPYGQPGDRLWVRETWREWSDAAWHYAADGTVLPRHRDSELSGVIAQRAPFTWESYRWRPSIHMPRWASRILLEITDVRVERLQDISRGDAMAEGCPFSNMQAGPDPRGWFAGIWSQINGPDSWAANPWVWVIEFRMVNP